MTATTKTLLDNIQRQQEEINKTLESELARLTQELERARNLLAQLGKGAK